MAADTEPLSSNSELHRYLLQTAESLTRLGLSETADTVRRAAASAAGLSTEFIGESKMALAEALRTAGPMIAASDRKYLSAVIRQLENALKRQK